MKERCKYCDSINCPTDRCNDLFNTMMKTQKSVRQPFFKGYEPQFYFKPVSPYRSDTKLSWEFAL